MLVLYSLAIENLLKGIIVANGDDPIERGGKRAGQLQERFTTHDLKKLATRARVTGSDTGLLETLSDFVRSGKYPAGGSDGEGESAHFYSPDWVLDGSPPLPMLEEHLATVPYDTREVTSD